MRARVHGKHCRTHWFCVSCSAHVTRSLKIQDHRATQLYVLLLLVYEQQALEHSVSPVSCCCSCTVASESDGNKRSAVQFGSNQVANAIPYYFVRRAFPAKGAIHAFGPFL